MDREGMAARKFLQEFKNLDCDITIQFEELNRLQEMITSLGSPSGEKVCTSGTSNKTENLAIRLKMLQDKAAADCQRWAELKIMALKTINLMSDRKHQQILHLYYIQDKTLTETASRMNISYQWASQLRKDAEAEFERLMPKTGLCGNSDEHISHNTN